MTIAPREAQFIRRTGWEKTVRTLFYPPRIRRRLAKGLKAFSYELRRTVLRPLTFNRIVEIRTDPSSVRGLHSYQKLLDPATLVFDQPVDRDFLGYSSLYADGTYPIQEAFVCQVRDAKVHVVNGVVSTADNALIAESAMEIGRLTDRSKAIHRSFVPRRLTFLEGTYATIMHTANDNYYHWIVDCLPRLYSLTQIDAKAPIRLLVPSELTPLQERTLAYCLPQNVELQPISGERWVQVGDFCLPSFVSYKGSGYLPAPYLDYVRSSIFRKLNLSHDHPLKRRIYISRQGATRRKVANDDEVSECLSEYGFETFRLEEMTFEDQVRLFHAAEIVVAPHGAGITNILFAGDIKIIELFPKNTPSTFYFFLAHCLGQEYHYLFGSPFTQETNAFGVNVPELRQVVAGLIDSPVTTSREYMP
jgi:capsular polysaccharide biosynthesis protein